MKHNNQHNTRKISPPEGTESAQELVFINPRKEQLHVGYYFVEARVKEFEEAIKAKSSWFGWLGMLVSCGAGLYATQPKDTLWLIAWTGLGAISLTMLSLNAWNSIKLWGRDHHWLLKSLTGQDDGTDADR